MNLHGILLPPEPESGASANSANRLNQLPDAAKRVFPGDLKPFEIVLFQDGLKYDKAWIEVFPGSRIKPSIGRAGFV